MVSVLQGYLFLQYYSLLGRCWKDYQQGKNNGACWQNKTPIWISAADRALDDSIGIAVPHNSVLKKMSTRCCHVRHVSLNSVLLRHFTWFPLKAWSHWSPSYFCSISWNILFEGSKKRACGCLSQSDKLYNRSFGVTPHIDVLHNMMEYRGHFSQNNLLNIS